MLIAHKEQFKMTNCYSINQIQTDNLLDSFQDTLRHAPKYQSVITLIMYSN